ncbi:MAG: TIGR02466 family protein [Gammaproteobacteria bacterium]|nr:TIGR02466 family protein [Gammaproteobacteria bacterium]
MDIVARAVFPTVVWSVRFEDHVGLNRDLLAAVLALRERDRAGVSNTNVNGWQSHNTIQLLKEFGEVNGRISAICQQIGESAGFAQKTEYRYQAWANINPPGASNQLHIHPNCHLSGVYYITAPRDCGSIFFRDPRSRSLMAPAPLDKTTEITATEMTMVAEPGRLYVFPAWLEHGVQINRGTQDRIGISFNIQVVALPGSGK